MTSRTAKLNYVRLISGVVLFLLLSFSVSAFFDRDTYIIQTINATELNGSFLRQDGTNSMTGNLNIGGNQIVDMSDTYVYIPSAKIDYLYSNNLQIDVNGIIIDGPMSTITEAIIDIDGDITTTSDITIDSDTNGLILGDTQDKKVFANGSGMYFETQVGDTPYVFDNDITATGTINLDEVQHFTSEKIVIEGITARNTRGLRAVDIQTGTIVTDIASGADTTAVGQKNIASGQYDVAVGYDNTATGGGYTAVAVGMDNEASGFESFAAGIGNTASGFSRTTAIGVGTTASGDQSVAFGYGVIASGETSIAMGANSIASGYQSIALGSSYATGTEAVSIGHSNQGKADGSFALGSSIYTDGDDSLAIGSDITTFSHNHITIGTPTTFVNLNSNGFSINNVNALTANHFTGEALVTDASSLGSELVTNGAFTGSATGWTLGTGWNYNSNRVDKYSDGAGTLSQTIAGLEADAYYELKFYISISTVASANTLNVTLGGSSIEDLIQLKHSTAGRTYKAVIKTTTTGDLIFAQTDTSRFYIDTVSVKKITDGAITALGDITIDSDTNGLILGDTQDKKVFANGSGMYFETQVGDTPYVFDNDITTTCDINATTFNGAWNGSSLLVPYTGANTAVDLNTQELDAGATTITGDFTVLNADDISIGFIDSLTIQGESGGDGEIEITAGTGDSEVADDAEDGGDFSLASGIGGTVTSAGERDDPGNGGEVAFEGGNGGNVEIANIGSIRGAGIGGDTILEAGNGGSYTTTAGDFPLTGMPPQARGGIGGLFRGQGGTGGAVIGNADQTSASTNLGGVGGEASFLGGTGGNSNTAFNGNNVGAKGGDISFMSGAGGQAFNSLSSNTGGDSGDMFFIVGQRGGAGGASPTQGTDGKMQFVIGGEIGTGFETIVGTFLSDHSGFQQNDEIKHYWGTEEDISTYFTGADYLLNAEVGTPKYNITGFEEVNIDTDLNIIGNFTGNQIYGSVYGNELGDITITSLGAYYNVTGLSQGLLNGFSFNTTGQDELTALVSGTYKIDSGWSFSGSANTEYHIRIAKNGVNADNCHGQRKIGTGGDVGSASTAPCLVALTIGDKINIQIENVDNSNNAFIHDVGMTVWRIGN